VVIDALPGVRAINDLFDGIGHDELRKVDVMLFGKAPVKILYK
jgi:hypothetical protein